MTNSIRCGDLMLSTVMPLKMLKACHSSVNISESSFSHVYGSLRGTFIQCTFLTFCPAGNQSNQTLTPHTYL